MKILNGQVALITGASRGLGVYIARAFAKRGVNLVLAARSLDAVESLAAELSQSGIRAIGIRADMSRAEDVEALYSQAKEAFGQVDFVINNAGIELVSHYLNLSPEDIDWVIRVNLTGPMLLSRLALDDMYERDSGHIVNIASAAGSFPPPYSETYAATKSGLIGFTHSVRCSLRLDNKKVGASVIAPGFMDDAGMYENMKSVARKAPWFVGSLHAEVLAQEVLKVIEKNKPIKLLMPFVPTAMKVFQTAMPGTFEKVSLKIGIFRSLIDLANHRGANA